MVFRRRYRKKTFRRRRYGKGNWKRFAKKVRSVIRATTETKYSLGPDIQDPPVVVGPVPSQTYIAASILPGVPQGAQNGSRIGNKINPRFLMATFNPRLVYGNIYTDVFSTNDEPFNYYIHICHPTKGNCGAAGAVIQQSITAYFNNANNFTNALSLKPIIDTQWAKFWISRSYQLIPSGDGFLMLERNTGDTYNVPTKHNFRTYRFKRRFKKTIHFQYALDTDQQPSNYAAVAVFLNGAPTAYNVNLYVTVNVSLTYTDA